MKRVSLLFILSLLLFATAGRAQTFTTLITDPSGDYNSGGVPIADIKTLSYRVNTAGDSLWFKIETYNDILSNGDYGFMFGLDTNLVTTSGQTWNGANTSMHYDHALFLFQNGIMAPGTFYGELGAPGSSGPVNINVQKPNTKTLIVGMKYAPIDNNGNFNLLFGSGFFDISSSGSVFDEAPGTTYLQVRKSKAGIEEKSVAKNVQLYPNPATDRISWNATAAVENEQGRITDVTGKTLMVFRAGDSHADISRLAPGTYMLQLGPVSAAFVKK